MHKLAKKDTHPEVGPDLLRWRCDQSSLPFETTEDLDGGEEFFGQPRAQKAIQLGLELEGLGYHILVCGPPGTGRETLIRSLIQKTPERRCKAKDLLYVNNFKDPGRPLNILLPKGKGYIFRELIDQMIAFLKENIPGFLNEEYVTSRKGSFLGAYEHERARVRESFEEEVRKRSFRIKGEDVAGGLLPQFIPCPDGIPMTIETLGEKARKGEIPEEEYKKWLKAYRELSRIRTRLMVRLLYDERHFKEKVHQNVKVDIEELIHLKVRELRQRYRIKKIREYLNEVEKALLNHFCKMAIDPYQEQKDASGSRTRDPFWAFRVNLLVDNRFSHSQPVIFEPFPSLKNVFGTIKASWQGDELHEPEFMTIMAGALHRAFGGYLVLDLKDVVHDHDVWTNLKQCLRQNLIEMPPPASPSRSHPTLRPEPFPLEVKIIALVDEDLYRTLYNDDPEIDELFKIRADFDQVFDRTEENVMGYCSFLNWLCRKESLPPFHRSGAAVMVETGVERAGKKSKLSARLSDIADIACEAAYWARQEESRAIYRQHVEKALKERRYRNNLVDEQLRELIQEGTIHIETSGATIGQVNGIALYDLGGYVFGKPCRITAQTSMGRAGVVNIEREANLSGKFHDKGILILCGYLRDRYAHDKPLNLTASICIEQFYADIEGDSASLAEICALLSSLGGIPVKQGIAVTGAISQRGEVHSVGCVNQKVEGFFDVCRLRGLDGEQGVIIPVGNLPDLMLPVEIVEAVERDRFHIYQVSTVDDAMEVLTGWTAGNKETRGMYPRGTINQRVDDRLRELAERLRDFYNEVGEEEEKGEQE